MLKLCLFLEVGGLAKIWRSKGVCVILVPQIGPNCWQGGEGQNSWNFSRRHFNLCAAPNRRFPRTLENYVSRICFFSSLFKKSHLEFHTVYFNRSVASRADRSMDCWSYICCNCFITPIDHTDCSDCSRRSEPPIAGNYSFCSLLFNSYSRLLLKGPYLNDVYTEGRGGITKCRHSKGGCVDLVLWILPKCRQGGRGSKIPKIV